MAKDSFKFHTLQVSLSSSNLLSCISTLIVHMHARKACRECGGTAPHTLKVALDGGEFWVSPSRLFASREYPRKTIDTSEKWSLARNGIRNLDRPARSPVIVLQLFLLLRACLSTETKTAQVAIIKLFWAYAGVNRGKAPRIHDRGTRWWWEISFALRPQCRGKLSHWWSSDRRLRGPEQCCACRHSWANQAAGN